MKLHGVFKAVLSFLCVFCTQSSSLIAWGGPIQVSGLGSNFNPATAINSSLNAEVVWTSQAISTYNLVSTSYSGVSWSTPVIISSGLLDNAKVGIDASGNAVVVWLENDSGSIVVKSATKPAAGSWSVPVTLSMSSSNIEATVVMNPAGNAFAAWIDTTTNSIMTADLTFGGSWSVAAPIASSPSGVSSIDLAIDTAGNGYLVWINNQGNDLYAVVSSGTIWGAPILINPNGDNGSPSIGVGGVLQALTSWVNVNVSDIFATSFQGGTWNLVPRLVSSDNVSSPVVAATGNDGFTAWLNLNTGRVQCTNYNSGNWSHPPYDLGISTDNEAPQISIVSPNIALVAWSNFQSETVNVVSFPNGGIPSLETAISSVGNNSNVQSASRGTHSIVVWETVSGANTLIYANVD